MSEQQHENARMRALDPILYRPTEDLLHKESEFIDRFYHLVSHSVQPPFAISVDGLWGTGKTTVMKFLQQKLHDGGYSTFWFNPWKYRNTESVVLAFLKSLAGKHADLFDELPDKGERLLRVLLKSGMRASLNILTMKNVSLKNVEADLTEAEKAQMTSYQGFSDSVHTLEEEFRELIEAIGRKYSGELPVVVFFDDLDRCLPGDAIQLLEAVKNLFITPKCNCIFICGIDTRVAKKFIQKHYEGIEENFAINYFRKIFNLTISMPSNPKPLPGLLRQHIQGLLGWNEDDAKELARMISTSGRQAEMNSVRKYLNVVNNFYTFQQFNPEHTFSTGNDLIVYLLVLKEAWQPLYEELVQEAMKNRADKMQDLVSKVTNSHTALPAEQKKYLESVLIQHFSQVVLCDELLEYPTLA